MAMALATSDRAVFVVGRAWCCSSLPAGRICGFLFELSVAQGRRARRETARGRGALLGAARPLKCASKVPLCARLSPRANAYFATRPTLSPAQRVEQRTEPSARGAGAAPARGGGSGAQARCRARRLGRASAAAARVLGRLPALVRNRRALGRRAHRFHERLRYRRDLERADAHAYRSGAWSAERLQP